MHFPKLDKQSLTEGIVIPEMIKVRQSFPSQNLADPIGQLKEQLHSLDDTTIKGLEGKRIGITAGSRGLPHYKELMKVLCDQLKAWKAQPFVFPAMGSHAGATAEGQKAHLAQFGINEEYLGVPVLSTMDVVTVATLDDGFPIYCDKNAYEADGIILFNKIKPHTHFKYEHESGLLKMICIGCGKHKGASAFHGRGYDTFGPNLERVAKAFLNKVNVVFSVGMVQSPSDDIAALEVIPTDKFFERDAALQALAKGQMPRLKLPHIDVLIVDEIGKEISGTGMDPNITGRTERFSKKKPFVHWLRTSNESSSSTLPMPLTETARAAVWLTSSVTVSSTRWILPLFTPIALRPNHSAWPCCLFTATATKMPSKWPWPMPS